MEEIRFDFFMDEALFSSKIFLRVLLIEFFFVVCVLVLIVILLVVVFTGQIVPFDIFVLS